ncbi:hypothetical protein HELRODRAFT_64810 [Helobdella robusta]|uniref:GPR180/TMEM145 transmembrane domain-containing protein n=1 Tax=Helobdella robusta TaxID=6412 RepID=T1FXZ7_HELRO|nr:hypothetical protein HELRODRAFT_64810 [Helobdella robusta]ESO05882.1 hypothetical protein HELRODRAFT_64810 [Helobdella robusta]
MYLKNIVRLFLLSLISCTSAVYGLRLVGQWKTSDFYKFLVKFGFQQTDKNDETARTQGYIYGNITATKYEDYDIALVVLDSEYFLNFFTNRSLSPRHDACSRMFSQINRLAWDKDCNVNGKEDFIRYIPCRRDGLCRDELADRMVRNSQFTFRVQDKEQPRYWYISMVACSLNTTNSSCQWTHIKNSPSMLINYDIWLVNGDPDDKNSNFFEHHFSIEQFDVFEIYLTFFILYILIIPVQAYALSLRRHTVAVLLFLCLFLEFLGIVFNFVHYTKFAGDGIGVVSLSTVGKFFDLLAQSLFMLLLLLVVKGMAINCERLPIFTILFVSTVWFAYTASNIALFIWNLLEVQFISDVDEWQTWPGFLILTFRIIIMLWFLYELRTTFLEDHGFIKSRVYLHFGAGFMVWFIYLPIVAIIGSNISTFWRFKTIQSLCSSADFVSYCITMHLLWPTKKYLYFNSMNTQNGYLREYAHNNHKGINLSIYISIYLSIYLLLFVCLLLLL